MSWMESRPPWTREPGVADPLRVAVLASGSGSNFQALLDRFPPGTEGPVRIRLLVAGRPGIRALERAERAGVPTAVLPAGEGRRDEEAEADALLGPLEEAAAELVVLAGYLRLVPSRVVRAYWGRMVNIHPALLPAFGGSGMYGQRVHRAVLERGVRVTGVTVHFVDERYDRGPIIVQWPVPVHEDDDEETLARRVLEVEHRLLPAAVEALARGWARLSPEGRCRWTRPWFPGDRFHLAAGEADGTAGGVLVGDLARGL